MNCANCKKEFKPNRWATDFCSGRCKIKMSDVRTVPKIEPLKNKIIFDCSSCKIHKGFKGSCGCK